MTPDSIRDNVEELLKPRYKLTTDYPGRPKTTPVGFIFIASEDEIEKYFSKYPAIFKRLHWYEEREESEMPEYVCFKTAIPLTYKKVTKWWLDADKNWWADYDKKSTMLNMWAIEPATLAEYTDYLTQINKK